MRRSTWSATILVSGCLTIGLVVAACGSSSNSAQARQASAASRAKASRAQASAVAMKLAADQAAARKAAANKAARAAALPRVTLAHVRSADGSEVRVAIFRGDVRYVLHDGSQDPYIPAGRVRARAVVSISERHRLIAAFNGGFKMVARAGGYEQEGQVFYGLRAGLASLVIDRSGKAGIGVWGRGFPAHGTDVYSVRQNLQPLVLDGKPTGASSDWSLWGATLGGGEYVARSAVGQDSAGNIIYVASMSTTPDDLARALVQAGARVGMELDINPAWVQLDVANKPGATLRAEVPGQIRPADQYLYGWSRDFFTVVS